MAAVPPLDDQALARLRALVAALHGAQGRAVPMRELVALAAARLGAGVTVDFAATRALGSPMIVLRVPDDGGASAALVARLSPRERQVAGLVADGLSNKEIAARLGLSLATVKDHVHHILDKTGLPNRAAVASAVRGG